MPPTTDLQSVGGAQLEVGLKGDLYGPVTSGYDIESRVNDNATALDFGDVACQSAAGTPTTMATCKPMASGATVIGITVRERSRVADSSGNVLYVQYSTVRILKIGWIWAQAAENVTAETACIGVVASPGAVGSTTGGAADGTTRLAFPTGCLWKQTVVSGAVGLIHMVTA